ncbi:MAG: urea ABC transporter substrate-binding protein, partial [candidate division NC10 bacterium]
MLGAGAAAGLGFPAILAAQGGGPVKVGVLHSLSGTMAISEVSLRDVVLTGNPGDGKSHLVR